MLSWRRLLYTAVVYTNLSVKAIFQSSHQNVVNASVVIYTDVAQRLKAAVATRRLVAITISDLDWLLSPRAIACVGLAWTASLRRLLVLPPQGQHTPLARPTDLGQQSETTVVAWVGNSHLHNMTSFLPTKSESGEACSLRYVSVPVESMVVTTLTFTMAPFSFCMGCRTCGTECQV